MAALSAVRGATTAIFAAALCVVLILVLRPALQRHALAKPNARSSHREPTPQGGGVAVIVATVAAAGLGLLGLGPPLAPPPAIVAAAVVLIACVGAIDDIGSMAVVPRLILQALAVAATIYALPDQLRLLPGLPWWIERGGLFVAGLWFVNLVNFMDGIDWMTVAEVLPITATLVLVGCLGLFPPDGVVVALALGGAIVGFAYFNRPVAKLFLGDVGSLPIGLLLGWLLVRLAGASNLAAAVLPPLYYFGDATVTLLRRLLRGEPFWQAHRTHFYQLATTRGFSVTDVVARVFVVNICLCALAVMTIMLPGTLSAVGGLAAGIALVAGLLAAFARGRK
jgi:UDP-N-acetylmuramyl pentapeptide phosphotransferase/UDP-N-acetylglucosamine-1-phosphate transferase